MLKGTIQEAAEQYLERNKHAGFTAVSYAAFPAADMTGIAYYELRLEAPNREKMTRPCYEASPGVWELSKPDVPYAPCGAKEVALAATAGRIALAFWVEGPKKVMALRAQGCPACSSGGATSASPTSKCDFSALKALDLTWIFWPDNDPAGLKHAWEAYQQLAPKQALFMDPAQWPAIKGYDCVDAIRNGWDYRKRGSDKTLSPEQFQTLLPKNVTEKQKKEAAPSVKVDKEQEHWLIAEGWIGSQEGRLVFGESLIWQWDERGFWSPVLDDGVLLSSIRQWCLAHGYGTGSSKKAVSVLEIATYELPKKGESPRNRHIINCLNGQLEWTGEAFELKPHRREDFLTTQIPHNYLATGNFPEFKKALFKIFEHPEDFLAENPAWLTDELLEGFGLTLLQTPRFERSYWLYGDGATGKSTVLAMLAAMLGEANYSSRSLSSLTDKFARLELLNKYANIATELSAKEVLEDGPLKALISGETVTADRKFKSAVNFKNRAIFWFASNNPPNFDDKTSAIARRITVIPFRKKFAEKANLNLKEDLCNQGAEIFSWAVEGAVRLLKRGRIEECEVSQKAKLGMLREIDPVKDFVADCFTPDAGAQISIAEVFQIYTRWTEEQGITDRYRLTKRQLVKRCLQVGFKEGRTMYSKTLLGFKEALGGNFEH